LLPAVFRRQLPAGELELSQELTQFIHNIQGLYLDSIIGYKLINSYIEKDQSLLKEFVKSEPELTTDEFQDKLTFQHKDIYGDDFAASAIHFAKKGEVKKRNRKDGENSKLIANMCIVMMCSYWEHYFRNKLSNAYGYSDANAIQDDFWGDICWLRNDIVHNKNRCEKSKKAKVLRWFASGDEIIISQDRIRLIFLNALRWRNKLHRDSLAKIVMKIPKIDKKA